MESIDVVVVSAFSASGRVGLPKFICGQMVFEMCMAMRGGVAAIVHGTHNANACDLGLISRGGVAGGE